MMTRPDVPPLPWQPVVVMDFFRFIAERHTMFVRRVIQRKPPPWTTNPTLATVYFTNAYRELDRGTRYVINRLLDRRDPVATFFNVVAYRAFNKIETHEALVKQLGRGGPWPSHIVRWTLPSARRAVQQHQRTGAHVFTGAFLITGSGNWSGTHGKIGLVCENLTWIWRRRQALYEQLQACASMEEAHAMLTTLPGIGAFMAYELVVDFCYRVPEGSAKAWSLLPFTEDDWVNPGPGCRRGIALLIGRKPKTFDEAQAAIYDLWNGQTTWLSKARALMQGPPLTLRNIEHCLCEYQKYHRSESGSGHAKRGYRAATHNSDYSPWETLPKSLWRTQ